jgi:hypothetical protein
VFGPAILHRLALAVRRALLTLVLLLAAPAHASAAPPAQCPGAAIRADRAITGAFPADLQGGYVRVPFDVPAGTTSVRVKYCYDQPEVPTPNVKHTLDLGIYDPRGFRGWGGSSHPDVTLSAAGATRAFRPGKIRPGRWFAELGLAAIADTDQGDADGSVGWRVEVELSAAPVGKAYKPARYRTKPARTKAGWYTGDLHVHAEHSATGDASMAETFKYAFGPAKLDFITLTDYVTDSAWGEIGRYAKRYKRNVVGRSAEIITYRGHTNNQLSGHYVDYRTGPVYELRNDGGVVRQRAAQPASRIFRDVHRGGGFTQINHPTIFPSSNPLFAMLCRGCPWDYTDGETRYRQVDAIEVNTGPQRIGEAPNPFTSTAIDFYERALAQGSHAAAVASSDSHHAGEAPEGPTQSPVGIGATVVRAKELSERGIRCAVKAGHTYAKIAGSKGPDLRFTGRVGRRTAIFGDRARGKKLALEARATGPGVLQLVRNGVVVASGVRTLRRTVTKSGRYGLRLVRGQVTEAVGTPIWFTHGKRGRVTSRGC